MPELLLELFSEEIPARMQARAADDLVRAVQTALAPLRPANLRGFAGPRRVTVACGVESGTAETVQSERGPRTGAPEQALAGFLRKHAATRDELREENGFFVLHRTLPGQTAAALIARELPALLWKFSWPKSMRWGGTSAFTWVRPLRRILCILDGETIPFDLRQGDDDGHGLRAGNLTEGHRFLSPGAFAVRSVAEWETGLRARHVIVDAGERRRSIAEGLAERAAAQNLSLVPDEGLLTEVAGLVEWPVPLIGRIDPAYMDLPPEVMQVSMRVNQRYFALRNAAGDAAPYFAFVANIEASDGGAAIVAGNERVLRARFSDARHFWDLDRRTKLADRVAALDKITFHAKLGSQGDRVRRLVKLAGEIAPLVVADIAQAQRAALLAKADLTTGMVGEFPELQGIMGGYYARHDGEDRVVWEAVREHYAPRGPDHAVPNAPVSIAVALADKLDQIVQFFAAGEKPTGSGDPFALRRAALGILRILQENRLDTPLRRLLEIAGAGPQMEELLNFLKERLRVSWRSEGRRHDILAAAFANEEDSITSLLARTNALTALIGSNDGADLLSGYRRAANILQIENKKDGPHTGDVDAVKLEDPAEKSLADRAIRAAFETNVDLHDAQFVKAMNELAQLRGPLDAFFDRVTVNSPQPEIRRNRLRLLASVVETMNRVADFSKIEG
jgi:glycyl-tRNA synthetase beta chain